MGDFKNISIDYFNFSLHLFS